MSHMDVGCIVFDVDDTLFLERDYARSGFAAVQAWAHSEWGVEDFGAKAWEAFEAGHRGRIFNDVLEGLQCSFTDVHVGQLVRLYREHLPQIELLPDARLCLNRAAGQVRLAGVTDGPVECQSAKVEALKLRSWLNPLILTGELGSGMGKPHPASFELVESSTDCSGRRCIYVADNPTKDFAGPKSLGWQTVRIRRPMGLYSHYRTGTDVDQEFDSLDPLLSYLGLVH